MLGQQENPLLFTPEKELNYESGNYLEISPFGFYIEDSKFNIICLHFSNWFFTWKKRNYINKISKEA